MKGLDWVFLFTLLLVSLALGCTPALVQEAVKPDIDFIKENLEVGMEKEDIKGIFGDDYATVTCHKFGNEVWRYDYSEESSYSFVTGVNDVDVDALEKGILSGQLFLGWTGAGALQNYSFLYYNEADGRVYHYAVYPGVGRVIIKEEPITQ